LAASIFLHLLILLLIAGPYLAREALLPDREGAGGPGPAGGGGGGRGGTGGEQKVRFVRVAPPPPAATKDAVPTLKPPVIPPPQPKPEPLVPPQPSADAKDASPVLGAGGGSGKDGSTGSGPGSGGGVGSGVGTGTGSGIGPGTGGGSGKIYPPTVTNLAILPIPVPGKVRPYKLVAFFDVDERGNATLISFTPSRDNGYNKKIREMLAEVRFRPAVRADGRPVRDTTWISAEAPM
jgi:periplasmic protein TonB